MNAINIIKNKLVAKNDQFNKLPINVFERIIFTIPQMDNMRTRCMYRRCNKTWNNIIDNTKSIEISDKDIIKGISSEYLSRINDKITILNIKQGYSPHAIRAQILYDFIKCFSRLEEITLWTRKQYTTTDLNLLLRIDVRRFKIIDNNTNLPVFYLKDEKLKIFSFFDFPDIKEEYSDIEILISDQHYSLNDQWSWFKGEIYVNPLEYKDWMNFCKAIHLLDPSGDPDIQSTLQSILLPRAPAYLLPNIQPLSDIRGNVISYTFSSRNEPTNFQTVVRLLSKYNNIKTIILKGYTGDDKDDFSVINNDLDLLELQSTEYHFNLKNLSTRVKCYKITAPSIKIDPNLRNNFYIEKKDTHYKLTRRY